MCIRDRGVKATKSVEAPVKKAPKQPEARSKMPASLATPWWSWRALVPDKSKTPKKGEPGA